MRRAHSSGRPAPVAVTIPSDAAVVHVLRTVAAAVAARLPLSIDEIDDVRLAVDEAAAKLVRLPGSRELRLELREGTGSLEIVLSTEAAVVWPEPGVDQTLPWKILNALAEQVAFEQADGRPTIRMIKPVLDAP